MTELRTARPEEHEVILRHLDSSYGFAPGTFLSIPNRWVADAVDWDHTYLLTEDGQIASLVRTFPLEMVLGGAKLTVGGIGSVSTAPWARGRGYMARLMEHAVERMRADGHVVSVLWGDRHRYAPFGYEPAGRRLQGTITARGLAKLDLQPVSATRWQGQPDLLDRLIAAYDAHEWRRVRRRIEYERLLTHDGGAVYCAADGERFAYVAMLHSGDSEHLAEYGGDPTLVLRLCAARMQERGLGSLTLMYPSAETIPAIVREVASGWSVTQIGAIRVVDPAGALAALADQPATAPVPTAAQLAALPVRHQALALFDTLAPGPYNLWVWRLDHV